MATLGEQLQCRRETSNPCDPYAIAVVNNEDFIVGHVPRSVSTLRSLFLQRGGNIMCEVTGARRYSSDLPQGGLELPCKLIFSGPVKETAKIKRLFQLAPSDKTLKLPNVTTSTVNTITIMYASQSTSHTNCSLSAGSSVTDSSISSNLSTSSVIPSSSLSTSSVVASSISSNLSVSSVAASSIRKRSSTTPTSDVLNTIVLEHVKKCKDQNDTVITSESDQIWLQAGSNKLTLFDKRIYWKMEMSLMIIIINYAQFLLKM